MKYIKIILVVLFVPLFIISSYNISLAYNNDKTLFYDGKSKTFSYYNTNNQILFEDFKDMMPGDKKEDIFTISAKNISKDSRLYMDIKNNEVLDYVRVQVYKKDEVIFDSYKETEKKALLHTFTKDEDIDIKFVISISTEVNNEVDNATFSFDLNFIIEDDEGVYIPATYDSSHIIRNSVILGLSLVGIIYIVVSKKKERFNES